MTAEKRPLSSHNPNKNIDSQPLLSTVVSEAKRHSVEQSQVSAVATVSSRLEQDFGIEVEGLSLSRQQLWRLHALYRELHDITGAGHGVHLPEARHRELEVIDRKIVALFDECEGRPLNVQQSRELDELHQRANDILGVKPLTDSQQVRVERIHSEIDGIFSEDANPKVLDADVQRLESLFDELDSIRRELPLDSLLMAQINNVRQRIEQTLINEPYYMHTLCAQFDELDRLLGNRPLTELQQQRLHQVDERIFEVLGQANTAGLSRAQLTQLYQWLYVADTLLGRPRFTDLQSRRIGELNDAIADILVDPGCS